MEPAVFLASFFGFISHGGTVIPPSPRLWRAQPSFAKASEGTAQSGGSDFFVDKKAPRAGAIGAQGKGYKKE
jgi:hypothetical protein